MPSVQFAVRGARRWRSLEPASGRVAGWGAARFVVVRGGRLERAPRGPVLRGLRALAAGRPSAVRCGPRLERAPRPESGETAVDEVRVRCCHYCCQQLNITCSADAACERGPAARASVGVQTAPAADVRRSSADCSGSSLRASNTEMTKNRTEERQEPIVRKKNTSKRKLPPGGRASPGRDAKRRNADKKISSSPTVDTLSSERKNKRSTESESRRSDGTLNESLPAARKQTQEIENNDCKELLITEEDVTVLRTFVDNDARNVFDVDLRRFDADDTYKGLIFYKLNPLVSVERCRRIAEMLRPGCRPLRAARLEDSRATRGRRARGGTRSLTTESPVKTRDVNEKVEDRKNITKSEALNEDAVVQSEAVTKDTIAKSKKVNSRIADKSKQISKDNINKSRRTNTVTKSKEVNKVNDTKSKEVNGDVVNRSKPINRDAVNRSKETNKETDTESKHINRDTVNKSKQMKRDTNTNSKEVNKENVAKTGPVERIANGQFKKVHRVLRESTTTTANQKIGHHPSGGARAAAEAGGAPRPLPKRAGREYSAPEDESIVRWVAGAGRARRVNGNQLWQELQPEHERATGHFRSWHSLRNRYLRYLLPALGSTSLPAAEASRLRAAAAAGCMRGAREPARRSPPPAPAERGAWARRPRPALDRSGPAAALRDVKIEKDTGAESSDDAGRARSPPRARGSSSSRSSSRARNSSSSRSSSGFRSSFRARSSSGSRSSFRARSSSGSRSSFRARSSSGSRSSFRARSSSGSRSSSGGRSSRAGGALPPRAMVRVPTPTYSELSRRFARRYRSTPNSPTSPASGSDGGPGPRRRTRSGRPGGDEGPRARPRAPATRQSTNSGRRLQKKFPDSEDDKNTVHRRATRRSSAASAARPPRPRTRRLINPNAL